MKNLLGLSILCCFFSTIVAVGQPNVSKYNQPNANQTNNSGVITPPEKALLLNFLDNSETALRPTIKNTDKALWNKKPSANEWSMAQCLTHLLIAEQLLLKQVKAALQKPAKTEVDLRRNDAWLISKVADRGVKVKTPLNDQPAAISQAEGLKLLKKSRKVLKAFLSNESLPLRTHFGKSPYGAADCYQVFLVLATHSHRHHQQMLEVMRTFEKNK